MAVEWQRHSVPPEFLQNSTDRKVLPPAMDGAELAETPLSLIEGGGVGIVLSLCDMLRLMLRTCDFNLFNIVPLFNLK